MAVEFLENWSNCHIFLGLSALLGDKRIIVIGSDLRSKLRYFFIFELITIGPTCQPEVGSSDGQIDTRWAIVHDYIFEFWAEIHGISASPSSVPPEGDPAAVDLAPEEEAVIGSEVRYLDHFILSVSLHPADADVRARPVMHLPFVIRLLIVKFAVYSQLLPHAAQVGHVLWWIDVVTQLVLDLDHDYRPSPFVEVRSDHLRQRCEVFFHLSFIEPVRLAHSQTLYAEESGGQSPEIPFRADIRPRPQQYLHIMLYRQFDKPHQISIICAEIEPPIPELVVIPHDVNAQWVEPHPLDHFDAVLPVLPRNARIVDFSGVDRQYCLEVWWRDRCLKFSPIGVPRAAENEEAQEDYHWEIGALFLH